MTQSGEGGQDRKILVRVDPDLADLIPGFLDNRRKDITAMQEALVQSDYETIRVLGHSMKGAGGGYGFETITEIGAALEKAAKGKSSETIRRWIGELSVYLDRVEIIYE